MASLCPSRPATTSALILAVLVVLAPVLMRIGLVCGGYGVPLLDPDAITYRQTASSIIANHSYSNVKVPFFSIVLAAFFYAFGDSDLTQRCVSFSFGVLAVLVVYKLGKREFGRDGAVLASFLLASNYYAVFNSFRGLREELCSVVLLTLVYFSTSRKTDRAREAVLASALTAILYFTRSDTALVVVPTLLAYLLLSSVAKKRKVPKMMMICVLVALMASVAAWSVYSISISGDPYAESTYYASWMYWFDIEKGVGVQSARNVTMTEYLFRYHTPLELASATARGALGTLAYLDFFRGQLPIAGLLLLGSAILCWKDQRNWYYLLLSGVALLYLGLFHGLGVIEIQRFMMPFEPVFMLAVSLCLVEIFRFVHAQKLSASSVLVAYGLMACLLVGYVCRNYLYMLAYMEAHITQAPTTASAVLSKLTITDLASLLLLVLLCALWFGVVARERVHKRTS